MTKLVGFGTFSENLSLVVPPFISLGGKIRREYSVFSLPLQLRPVGIIPAFLEHSGNPKQFKEGL
jgi:hypothetical protein